MDTDKPTAIQACIQTLADELQARAANDRALEKFVTEVRKVDADRDPHGERENPDHPAMSSLDRALRDVPPGSRVGDAVVSVASRLDWFPVFESDEINPNLTRNMISAKLAVRRDAHARCTVSLGLFLLAPGTNYPLHTHIAAELYHCVSGKLTLQHGIDGEPFLLLPGEYSITPSERLHALSTEDEAALLIYVWLSGPKSENWWWAQGPDGAWERSAWQWQPDGRWVRLGSETVSTKTLRKAGSRFDGQA